jgi:hypothetical protein
MQIKGKITKLLPTEYVGSNNTAKRLVIIETEGQYPKMVALTLWKDVANTQLNEGETRTFNIDIDSREYNGKWYNDIKAWKIESTFP